MENLCSIALKQYFHIIFDPTKLTDINKFGAPYKNFNRPGVAGAVPQTPL